MLLVKLVSPEDEILGPAKTSLQRVCVQHARVAPKQQFSPGADFAPGSICQCLEMG